MKGETAGAAISGGCGMTKLRIAVIGVGHLGRFTLGC
jgi:hypothetical protein